MALVLALAGPQRTGWEYGHATAEPDFSVWCSNLAGMPGDRPAVAVRSTSSNRDVAVSCVAGPFRISDVCKRAVLPAHLRLAIRHVCAHPHAPRQCVELCGNGSGAVPLWARPGPRRASGVGQDGACLPLPGRADVREATTWRDPGRIAIRDGGRSR